MRNSFRGQRKVKCQINKLVKPIKKVYFTRILPLLLSLLLLESFCDGAMLKWNPNSEINLAGYRVYFGMVSKLYKSFVDVGKATQYALGNLSESTTYFFSVTAYNFDGVESAPSDELVFYADDGIPSYRDNCPADYNPGQEDTFPPNGNEIGDACDCEADFN